MSNQLAVANKSITDMLQKVVEGIFQQKFKVDTVEFNDIDIGLLKFSEQMALILLNGPKLRMFFKLHFALGEVKELLKEPFPRESFDDRRIKDYMKELSNLVAGKLKSKLANANLKMGQSLPISLVGYNEIFFRQEAGKHTFAFEVILSGQRVLCSTSLEYTADDAVLEIAGSDMMTQDDTDDVDFL